MTSAPQLGPQSKPWDPSGSRQNPARAPRYTRLLSTGAPSSRNAGLAWRRGYCGLAIACE